MSSTVPAGARRLFPDVAEPDLSFDASPSLLFARLLEDGDRADLRWLFSRRPESEVSDWLARVGGRKLSRRSRAYWEIVLGRAVEAPPAGASDLWPL